MAELCSNRSRATVPRPECAVRAIGIHIVDAPLAVDDFLSMNSDERHAFARTLMNLARTPPRAAGEPRAICSESLVRRP
jgi:hypothetical protein